MFLGDKDFHRGRNLPEWKIPYVGRAFNLAGWYVSERAHEPEK